MKVYYESYGCTANRGDLEIMLGLLAASGHEPISSQESADVLLINTCAVKGATYRKMLRRIGELKKTGKGVLVTGCLPLIDSESVLGLHPNGVISCRTIDSVVGAVESIARGGSFRRIRGDFRRRAGIPRHRLHPISAIINIAEGCTSACTYCSVKLARGGLRSLPVEDAVAEAESSVRSGMKEILLTAQDSAAYGLDIGSDLPSLLRRICAIEGRFMIRVGMMNPKNVKTILPDLLEAYGDEKVYKFLHLPVQSGDDGVLELMDRGYRCSDYVEIVESFRNRFPDLYLATDVIVGFPGEGDAEFRNTVDIIERTKPDKVNISRFSPMPGTKAAEMKAPNSGKVAERSRLLASIVRRIGQKRNREYVGREWLGLVTERGKKGGFTVRLPNYKPTIVRDATPGEFIRVRITGHTPTYLFAENLGRAD